MKRPKRSYMVFGCWCAGILTYGLGSTVKQLLLGKEAYFENLQKSWVDIPDTIMWLAVAAGVYLVGHVLWMSLKLEKLLLEHLRELSELYEMIGELKNPVNKGKFWERN